MKSVFHSTLSFIANAFSSWFPSLFNLSVLAGRNLCHNPFISSMDQMCKHLDVLHSHCSINETYTALSDSSTPVKAVFILDKNRISSASHSFPALLSVPLALVDIVQSFASRKQIKDSRSSQNRFQWAVNHP